MNLFLNITEALSAIKSNFLRTTFTVLIITTGIFSLIGILTTVEGIKNSIQSNLSSLGSNVFEIKSKGFTNRFVHGKKPKKSYPPITYKQALMFKEKHASSTNTSLSTFISGIATIKANNEATNPNIQIMGIDEQYVICESLELHQGRNFTEKEVSLGSNVAIIGYEVYKKLFNEKQAVQQRITFSGRKYLVVGVLKNKGSFMGGAGGSRSIMIPIKNGRKLPLNIYLTYQIKSLVKNSEDISSAIDVATGLMRRIRQDMPGQEDSFEIMQSNAMVRSLDQISSILKTAGWAISLITLLGASIGLVNIMLVSVTERTREIGVRKALGATPFQIAIQFLIEAILICVIGGLTGIASGALIGNIIAISMGNPTFYFPWEASLASTFFCIIIGILAGIFPAIKGANMDPIESLRYE